MAWGGRESKGRVALKYLPPPLRLVYGNNQSKLSWLQLADTTLKKQTIAKVYFR